MPNRFQVGLIAIAVGFLAGYMLRPEPEVKIKEVVKVEKQVDEKIVVVESPDGTKTTTIDRTSKTKAAKSLDVSKKNPQKDWLLGAHTNLTGTVFGGSVHRRVLGDIYVGGSVDTMGDVLVGVTLLF